MKDLNGKVVLITGAARGMGKIHAFTFAREGCRVVLTDVDPVELEKAAAELRESGFEAHAYEHDVSDYDRCVALADRVEREVGPVDVLINNAGIVYPETILAMDAGMIRRITEVNYLGTVWMTKAFAPSMVRRKTGHVVNIGSQAAKMGMVNLGAYCGTKFGIVGFTDSIRQELKKDGVRFSIINPGFVSTGMFEGARIPFLTRWLAPQDVSNAMLRAVRKNKAEVFLPFPESWLVGLGRGMGLPRVADLTLIVMGARYSTSKMLKDRGRPF